MLLSKASPIRSKKIREAARGQRCTVRLPGVCCHDSETTVLAHFSYASSGMGIKPGCISAAFCCHYCHAVVDGRAKAPVQKDDIEWCKARGMAETWQRLAEMGVIEIKGVK